MERERRDAIWSVSENTRTAYLIGFTGLYGTGLGLMVVAGVGEPGLTLPQTVVAHWIAAGAIALASAASAMAVVEIGGTTMVLLDRALKARRKYIEGLLDRGREEGREERDREAMAWYERMEAARREGTPFDEPPPFADGDGRSANGRSANGRSA